MPSVTDGEFRRRSWSAGFIDAVDGFGLREGTIEFRTQAAGHQGRSRPVLNGAKGAELSPYAKARLQRKRAIAADDYGCASPTWRKPRASISPRAP
jgi:methionine synthase II (cobalamin-independent)